MYESNYELVIYYSPSDRIFAMFSIQASVHCEKWQRSIGWRINIKIYFQSNGELQLHHAIEWSRNLRASRSPIKVAILAD